MHLQQPLCVPLICSENRQSVFARQIGDGRYFLCTRCCFIQQFIRRHGGRWHSCYDALSLSVGTDARHGQCMRMLVGVLCIFPLWRRRTRNDKRKDSKTRREDAIRRNTHCDVVHSFPLLPLPQILLLLHSTSGNRPKQQLQTRPTPPWRRKYECLKWMCAGESLC